MKLINIARTSLLLMSLITIGCGVMNQNIQEISEPDKHKHSYGQTRAFGNQHHHAIMTYNSKEGILKIIFKDKDDNPATIFKAKGSKALLTLSNGDTKKLYLLNSKRKRYPPGSRRAKNQIRLRPPSDTIYTKADYLKKLSAFSLKVWFPFEGKTYVIKYEYPGNEKMVPQG
jgi:hypothetical protein